MTEDLSHIVVRFYGRPPLRCQLYSIDDGDHKLKGSAPTLERAKESVIEDLIDSGIAHADALIIVGRAKQGRELKVGGRHED